MFGILSNEKWIFVCLIMMHLFMGSRYLFSGGTSKEYVVIVDPYTSGSFLAPEFKAREYECIAIHSNPLISEDIMSSYHRDDFAYELTFDGNIHSLINELSKFDFNVIIAGSEPGVLLTDQLNDLLGLSQKNVSSLSSARRNKYEMAETIRRNGIRGVEQIRSEDLEPLLVWARIRNEWPIVIKPVESAGTDDVTLCKDEKELKAAFFKIMGKKNVLGLKNEAVLAQEFLEGPEFVVDSVSMGGKNYVTAIWKYQKGTVNNYAFIYHAIELLPFSGQEQDLLVPYALQVMNSLGIQFGPAHLEIILTKSGPVLVEMGARIHGGTSALIGAECIGSGQVDLTVDACVDPAAFARKSSEPYRLKKHAKVAFLISREKGQIQEINHEALSEIQHFESFNKMTIKKSKGDFLSLTQDLVSCPGYVTFIHEDPVAVERDYQVLRRMDAAAIYLLEDHLISQVSK